MASKSGIENFQRPGNTDPNRMELPFPDIFFKTTRPSRLKAAEREKSESCCVSLMALLVGSYKARICSWYGMIALEGIEPLPCLQDYTYPQAEGAIALAEMECQNISIDIHNISIYLEPRDSTRKWMTSMTSKVRLSESQWQQLQGLVQWTRPTATGLQWD